MPMLMPAVTTFGMDLGMAGGAQAHEIVVAVRTTFCQRLDVMYFFNRNVDPVVKALLTERVRLCILLADTLPFRSVASFRFGLSVVAFISLVLGSLMLLAIPAFSKPRASGVSTWFLGFSGHYTSPSKIIVL